jgi:hypothetical protein
MRHSNIGIAVFYTSYKKLTGMLYEGRQARAAFAP